MPLRRSPFVSPSRNFLRPSDCDSSRNARRDRTTLLRLRSSSMIFASRSCPTNGCRSRTRRRSTSDAGRKPRSPMSRIRPPLTTSITGPVMVSPERMTSSMRPQARSYCARFLDRIRRPSLSSFCRTSASTLSPTFTTSFGSTSWRIESSLLGITPSDLYPMSSRTSSRSIFTTVPSTMSPSLKSLRDSSMAMTSSSGVRSRSGAAAVSVVSMGTNPFRARGAHRTGM